jgi:hypothetical protein
MFFTTNEFGHKDIDENDAVINAIEGEIVKYVANYYYEYDPECMSNYITKYKFIVAQFIGKIRCSKVRNSETIGIFIEPMYLYLDNKWHKIVGYKEPIYKSCFLYPHLLMLPNTYSTNAIHMLHTVVPVTLEDIESSDTITI